LKAKAEVLVGIKATGEKADVQHDIGVKKIGRHIQEINSSTSTGNSKVYR